MQPEVGTCEISQSEVNFKNIQPVDFGQLESSVVDVTESVDFKLTDAGNKTVNNYDLNCYKGDKPDINHDLEGDHLNVNSLQIINYSALQSSSSSEINSSQSNCQEEVDGHNINNGSATSSIFSLNQINQPSFNGNQVNQPSSNTNEVNQPSSSSNQINLNNVKLNLQEVGKHSSVSSKPNSPGKQEHY